MKVVLKILTICLAFLCLQMHAQGAPTKGRYMRLRCKPDTRNPNCVVEKGPLIDLPDPSKPNAPDDIEKYKFTPELQEEELSGEGSGADNLSDILSITGRSLGKQQELGAFAPEEGSAEVSEGSAAGDKPTSFQKVLERSVPAQLELKEDNLFL